MTHLPGRTSTGPGAPSIEKGRRAAQRMPIEVDDTVSDVNKQPDWGLRAPKTVDELGIPPALVTDLLLRRCLLEGKTTIAGLSQALALNPSLVDKLIRSFVRRRRSRSWAWSAATT